MADIAQEVKSGEARTEGEAIVKVEQNGDYQKTDDRGVGEPVPVSAMNARWGDRFQWT